MRSSAAAWPRRSASARSASAPPNNATPKRIESAVPEEGAALFTCRPPLPPPAICSKGTRISRTIDIEALCAEKGLRITEQRKIIARVLGESEDHPDVEALHARASAIDPGISIATVYRTVRLFEEAGIPERHDFGDGRPA